MKHPLATLALGLLLAAGVSACDEDTTDNGCDPGAQQCDGAQIQTCTAEGAWGEAVDCPEATMCSSGHDGMDYTHCMEMNDGPDGMGGMDDGMGGMDVMDHGPDAMDGMDDDDDS